MNLKNVLNRNTDTLNRDKEFWFPGRWVGGTSLIIGPILLLTGVLLRIQFNFFFPQQLTAYKKHPELLFTAYSFFLAGNMVLFPAIITLVRFMGMKKPGWAVGGGLFVIGGLFARTFHAGVDHLAFQLVPILGLESATNTVAQSYGAYHIVSALSPVILLGWVILAIGSYLSGTLGLLRSVALALMSSLMIGVLKGSSIVSVVATVGLCTALVPFGIDVLRQGPKPGNKAVSGWSFLVLLLIIALYFLGRLG